MKARFIRVGLAIATVVSYVLVLGAPMRNW
jgi:hypothetical protein